MKAPSIARVPAPILAPLLGAAIASWLAAGTARAVIVFEEPGRLTTMPVLSGGTRPGWQYIGFQVGDAFSGIPIGPRAWVTATHVSSSTGLVYDNAGTTAPITYTGTRAATSGDLAVMVLDADQPSFTQWAPVWSGTAGLPPLAELYVYGRSGGRSGVVTNSDPVPGTPKGWSWSGWGGYDGQQSFGTNQLDGFAIDEAGNVFAMWEWNQPTPENGLPLTEGILALADSGSAVFAFNAAADAWQLLGINSAVEVVQTAPGQPALWAAIYDMRGFYLDDQLVTGPEPVPAISYATSIPHKYEFLAPYIPVPEPAGWVLLAAAAASIFPAAARQTHDSGGRKA